MKNVSALFVAALFAINLAGCGNGAGKEEDSMAPLLEKAAKEQGIDSNTVKGRDSGMPHADPKAGS